MPMHGPVDSPVEWVPGNPNDEKGGPGVFNGEPGAEYQKRTMGPNSIPEKTLDECGEFKNAEKGADG